MVAKTKNSIHFLTPHFVYKTKICFFQDFANSCDPKMDADRFQKFKIVIMLKMGESIFILNFLYRFQENFNSPYNIIVPIGEPSHPTVTAVFWKYKFWLKVK